MPKTLRTGTHFFEGSPHRSIFVRSTFLRALGAPFSLVTVREGDRIVSGAPIMLDDAGRPLTAVYPFTMYQGLLHGGRSIAQPHSRVKHELEATEAFVSAVVEKHHACCFMQSWRFNDTRGFLWFHHHQPALGQFRATLGHTGVLDLTPYSSFDAYLAAIRKVRRYEWRHNDVEVRETTDVDLLDTLHAKTFERQGLARTDLQRRLLRSITQSALDNGYGRLVAAFAKGEPASATLFLYDDRTGFYLFGANDEAHRDSFASTVLLLHMIRDCIDRKLGEVDFVGVNSPSRGDFKTSFNADVRGYVTFQYGM